MILAHSPNNPPLDLLSLLALPFQLAQLPKIVLLAQIPMTPLLLLIFYPMFLYFPLQAHETPHSFILLRLLMNIYKKFLPHHLQTKILPQTPPKSKNLTSPSKLLDFVCNNVIDSTTLCGTSAPCFSGIFSYPITHYIFDEKFFPWNKDFTTVITTYIEPSRFTEALSIPNWRNAICSAIDALVRKYTWTVTTLPPKKKALGYKWVYRIK